MEHHPRDVWGFTQRWVADNVHVGKSAGTESIAETGPARAFDIGQDFQQIRDLEAGIERFDPGCRVLFVGAEAVWSGIQRGECGMLLTNEVRLRRDPEAVPKRVAPGTGRGRRLCVLGDQRRGCKTQEDEE